MKSWRRDTAGLIQIRSHDWGNKRPLDIATLGDSLSYSGLRAGQITGGAPHGRREGACDGAYACAKFMALCNHSLWMMCNHSSDTRHFISKTSRTRSSWSRVSCSQSSKMLVLRRKRVIVVWTACAYAYLLGVLSVGVLYWRISGNVSLLKKNETYHFRSGKRKNGKRSEAWFKLTTGFSITEEWNTEILLEGTSSR